MKEEKYEVVKFIDEQVEIDVNVSPEEENGWSSIVLAHQIESGLYNRQAKANKVTNFRNSLEYHHSKQAEDKLILESDLEKALIDHLEDFLFELGRGYMFVGYQQRILIGGINYYVDMVFYNKILKCYLLIDLKIGIQKPENFEQMNIYVNYCKNEVDDEDDNLPIEIILCAEKDIVVTEYSMEGLNNNIFASKYTYIIFDKEVLENEIKNNEFIE